MKRILTSTLIALASFGSLQALPPEVTLLETQDVRDASSLVAAEDMPDSGPFAVDMITLTVKQTPGFGGADIYVPQDSEGQKFPALTMIPGWGGQRKKISWMAPMLASHGFVVMVMDPVWNLDWPGRRSAAMIKALTFLTEKSPVAERVDADRLGIWGFSMGGGATLETATKLPNIKAAIVVAPWHTNKTFSKITQPTLVITGSKDTVAAPRVHGRRMFDSLKNAPERNYEELEGAEHTAAEKSDPRIAQLTLDWILRFLREGGSELSDGDGESSR